jgi:hypothetical protein
MTPATNNEDNDRAKLVSGLAFALNELPLFRRRHGLDLLLGRCLCAAAVEIQTHWFLRLGQARLRELPSCSLCTLVCLLFRIKPCQLKSKLPRQVFVSRSGKTEEKMYLQASVAGIIINSCIACFPKPAQKKLQRQKGASPRREK